MGRRLKASSQMPSQRGKAGEVTVTSMNQPKRGWTAETARDLLRQGYSPQHVAKQTGFDIRWAEAQLRRMTAKGQMHILGY